MAESGDFGSPNAEVGIQASRDEFVDQLGAQLNAMIDVAAIRGDQSQAVREAVIDIEHVFKKSNSEVDQQVGLSNVFPIIVATNGEPGFEDQGTSFVLYRRDGSSERFPGAGADYEVYRLLTQTPLGLFGLLAPYFNAPDSTNWVTGLSVTLKNVQNALEAVKNAPPTFNKNGLGDYVTSFLTIVETFITTRVEAKKVTRESFEEFGKSVYPLFSEGVKKAVTSQVNVSIPAIKKIKESLGDEWKEVYVVIPSGYSGAGLNPRKQILEHLLEKDRVDSHVIVTEKAVTIEEARSVVGRVIVNRAFAQVFFSGQESEESNQFRFNFSSRKDWYTDATVQAIQDFDALKVDVEVKTTTLFDVPPESDDEEEDDEAEAKPKKKKDKLGGFTSELVEV